MTNEKNFYRTRAERIIDGGVESLKRFAALIGSSDCVALGIPAYEECRHPDESCAACYNEWLDAVGSLPWDEITEEREEVENNVE